MEKVAITQSENKDSIQENPQSENLPVTTSVEEKPQTKFLLDDYLSKRAVNIGKDATVKSIYDTCSKSARTNNRYKFSLSVPTI